MHTLYSNPYQLLKHPTKQKGSQIQHPQLSVVIKSRSRKGSLGLRVQASKSPTEEQQNQRIRSSKTGTIGDALEYQQQQKQPNPTDGALSKVVDGASSPGTGKSPFSSNSSFSSSIDGDDLDWDLWSQGSQQGNGSSMPARSGRGSSKGRRSSTTTTAATTTSGASGSTSVRKVDEQDTPEGLADVGLIPGAPGKPDQPNWLSGEKDSYIWNVLLNDKDGEATTISTAVIVGATVAASVFAFDVSIQFFHDLPDIFAKEFGIGGGRATGFQIGDLAVPFRCIMPVGAGVIVAALQSQGFSPPLKGLTRAVEGVEDDDSVRRKEVPYSYAPVFRKALASSVTLGSGASLGPEAPSVELGANTAAVLSPTGLSKQQQRMLIAAGAAAGVTAAFDAPVAGALFAIEFVLKSSRMGLDRLSTSTVFVATAVAAGVENVLRNQGQLLGLQGAASHLVGRIPYFSVNKSLIWDVVQFGALGVGCAAAAVLLYEGVRIAETTLRPIPRIVSAPLGGLLCGIIALEFPQVQYGYINLEEIFRDSTQMSVASLGSLLLAKIAATSVCVGGGLVGGLFAPSLFLGALVGDIMGHLGIFNTGVADTTSYVVVGAAAVLGASCRAPLTAMALMVEITRDTGLLLPLLAAIGMSSLVTDYLEGVFSSRLEKYLVEMYLKEKALFWGAAAAEQLVAQQSANAGASNTVERVMGVTTSMYVRRTLPLQQAISAMKQKDTKAAVVVDDNFKVMGVVYLDQVEDEFARQEVLAERDPNFNRAT
mmetsp:Transcript_21002/g.58374  ORF Transcript_21002/g.58374 Transcript_21002/m.58374 type:complete len:766 (+) Transcript_21002:1061-3358(+)|eukprot:CAMPEP_0202337838 /NCGR_PEP_ID=MMETSP1126-20121109/362_1 /ASSEMBLY_ACC=CAM_ASM_000457 /TAXON_ID=3047 /ORGANISM="Dunaliella tertiolecta, Strain CCMP1320" /LENGTH=765 /DNA_ID=CAMNT_0048928113 /DNA_START=1244 /DNA_END=3541 /DNA_ORIENTATION=-